MWTILYKIFFNILLPPGIFVVLFISAGIIMKRNAKRRKGKGYLLFMISGIILYLMSISAVPNILSYPLEKGKLSLEKNNLKDVDGIIILGAGLYKKADNKPELTIEAKSRILEGLRIYNNISKKIIVTGGDPYNKGISEAETAKLLLINMGVKESDILIENKSRNTFENAKFSKSIADGAGIKNPVVVTSGIHMKRAEMSFKKAGFNFKESVSDRIYSKGITLDSFFPNGENLDKTKQILWEYIGLAFYYFKK